MSDLSLSQNETFQLMGTYIISYQETPQIINKEMQTSLQIKLLRENIINCGLMRTAIEWESYPDPYIRCALRLAISGIEKSTVKDLLVLSSYVNEKMDVKAQLENINLILRIVFCDFQVDGV